MPTGKENNGILEIHVNGKVYDNFEDMLGDLGDFVEDMIATNEPKEKEVSDCDQMAGELFATYMAFQKAGFNSEQAFELLLTIVDNKGGKHNA